MRHDHIGFRFCLLFLGAIMSCNLSDAADVDYGEIIRHIGLDIERLRDRYPQLRDFSSKDNVDTKNLRISYAYQTHEAENRAGWVSGVPNPDDDGVWFYIDLHDPQSTAQIHTQPVMIPTFLGEKSVCFLILEGRKTQPISGCIWEILSKYGVEQDMGKSG